MHSDEYWERRAIENADRRTKDTEEFLQYLTTVYNKTYSRITKVIREWYNRYASENDMTMAEAKKQLKAKELQEFQWTVEEYIDKATNESDKWAKELQRVSDRVHISRLEALRYQIHTELGITSESAVKSVSDHLGRMYNEEYYRSVFDVFQGTGIGRSFQQMDTRKVQIALERPWAYPSDNFSGRIWSNNAKLINTLDNELTQMVITGEKVDKVVQRVATKLDSSLSNTSRLVQTEEAHISTLARKEAHKELDIEKYTFVCTLDERTCPVCGTMDKKTFNESDRKEGINSAPLHPWCRCTDMPYYDDMETGTRTARDGEGKTYRVPENITYEEWKNGLRVKEGRVIPKKEFKIPKKKVEPEIDVYDIQKPIDWDGMSNTKQKNYLVREMNKMKSHPPKRIIDNAKVTAKGVDDLDTEKWWDALTTEEREAVRGYTGSDYSLLNKGLYDSKSAFKDPYDRSRFFNDKYTDKYRYLDSALKKYRLDSDVIVHRGMGKNPFPFELNSDAIGKEGIFDSYTSTSISSGFGGSIQFRITVPKSTGVGAYIGNRSKFPNEKEFLIARGTKFRILDVDKGWSKTVVELEVIP